MSWRLQLKQALDVILRIPPLYVLNSILNQTFLSVWITDSIPVFSLSFVVWCLVNIFCFVCSVIGFGLDSLWLVDTYRFLLASGVMLLSFWFNSTYVQGQATHNKDAQTSWELLSTSSMELQMNITFQLALAFSYNSLRIDLNRNLESRHSVFVNFFQTTTYLWFLQPVLLHLIGVPAEYFQLLPKVSLLLMGVEFLIRVVLGIRPMFRMLHETFYRAIHFYRTYGLQTFVENEWARLHVPLVLRLFYFSRLVYHIMGVLFMEASVSLPASEVRHGANRTIPIDAKNAIVPCTIDHLIEVCQYLLISGCDTFISLLGMTSVVSYIANFVGLVAAAWIGSRNEDDRNLGTVAAILFFILALQTGLTGMEPEQRLNRLYKNACLLLTAVLHFIHSMVAPLLMNLSASHNTSFVKHARVLAMCVVLLTFPCFLGFYLWSNHLLSTWLLAVTAFSIEVVIKVIITLTIYSLFVIDACRETFWEKLDDYVYYVKCAGNTIEFFFGIFLFCNGAWIFFFESGGAIRAFMMCIHAYFNIWVQAKEGWKVFVQRQAAVRKINSIPVATNKEIEEYNDVCAICYQQLERACITQCQHLFHSVCLRKWLYLQDKCPMCHAPLYQSDSAGKDQGDGLDQELNGNPPAQIHQPWVLQDEEENEDEEE